MDETKTCDGCLYLAKGKSYIYCSMRNLMLKSTNERICEKWKRKPKRRKTPELNTEWVQTELPIDEKRSFGR